MGYIYAIYMIDAQVVSVGGVHMEDHRNDDGNPRFSDDRRCSTSGGGGSQQDNSPMMGDDSHLHFRSPTAHIT